mgnify:CR=1 FL=1
MCKKFKDIKEKLVANKPTRDTALAHQIRNNEIIDNVCGAMHKIKGLYKWAGHYIGQYYFRPCRTKGVHPGKKNVPIVTQIHHINGDCCDDRPENHVRLCLLCHAEVEALKARMHRPNMKGFRDWFRTESYTTSKGFKNAANKGVVPGHIPPNPSVYYQFRNEWNKLGGWEYIIPKKYYKLATKAGTKMRARVPNLKSWTSHMRLMKKYKITNKKDWNKLIKKISGEKKRAWKNKTGYLTADAFIRIFKKEWVKFGQYITSRKTTLIRFHYLGKKADWSHNSNQEIQEKKAKELQKQIRKLIKQEDKSNPYTDKQIQKLLERKSVEVIRIHRNKIGIPNYKERKKKYAKRSTKRTR